MGVRSYIFSSLWACALSLSFFLPHVSSLDTTSKYIGWSSNNFCPLVVFSLSLIFWYFVRVFIYHKKLSLMKSVNSLIHPDHNLKCSHRFFCDYLDIMKLKKWFLLPYTTSLMSWVTSLSITEYPTRVFRRLITSRNTPKKLLGTRWGQLAPSSHKLYSKI